MGEPGRAGQNGRGLGREAAGEEDGRGPRRSRRSKSRSDSRSRSRSRSPWPRSAQSDDKRSDERDMPSMPGSRSGSRVQSQGKRHGRRGGSGSPGLDPDPDLSLVARRPDRPGFGGRGSQTTCHVDPDLDLDPNPDSGRGHVSPRLDNGGRDVAHGHQPPPPSRASPHPSRSMSHTPSSSPSSSGGGRAAGSGSGSGSGSDDGVPWIMTDEEMQAMLTKHRARGRGGVGSRLDDVGPHLPPDMMPQGYVRVGCGVGRGPGHDASGVRESGVWGWKGTRT